MATTQCPHLNAEDWVPAATAVPETAESPVRAEAQSIHPARYQPAVLPMALLAVSRRCPVARSELFAAFPEAPLDFVSASLCREPQVVRAVWSDRPEQVLVAVLTAGLVPVRRSFRQTRCTRERRA